MNAVRLPSILLVACLMGTGARTCEFNVRDLGFFELGDEDYPLYLYTRLNAGTEAAPEWLRQGAARLESSNVRLAWVDLDREPDHPAWRYLGAQDSRSLPALVLVSPDGPWKRLAIEAGPANAPEPFLSAIQELIVSPAREKILAAVTEAFAVILLIEGTDSGANAKAREVIQRSIGQIQSRLGSMPKAVSKPPVLLSLDPASQAKEQILLWSLGLEETGETRAAIIYGRARWMGPLMQLEEITEPNVVGLLSIIGEDCECGMDIAWTRGTRLPARWTQAHRVRTAKHLGFDPESPMVLARASRILGRQGALASVASTQSLTRVSAAGQPIPPRLAGSNSPAQPMRNDSKGSAPILAAALATLGALGVLTTVMGVWIWRRRRDSG